MAPLKKSSKRLGKGLTALITDTALEDIEGSETQKKEGRAFFESKMHSLKISQIKPNPNQPREHFDKVKLEELALSLKAVGMIEPVVVSPKKPGQYTLIAGERRWRAAKLAGFNELPAVVKNDVEEDLLEIMLIENIQREDLSPIEEAMSFNLILKQKNLTHDLLAKRLGKSRSHITNTMRLLKLPAFLKKAVVEKKLSMGQVKVMVGLQESDQKELYHKIIKRDLSVREVEKIARNASLKKNKKLSSKRDAPIVSLQEALREKLQTKVKISAIKNRIGKIEIEFYDYDGLEAILEKMNIR